MLQVACNTTYQTCSEWGRLDDQEPGVSTGRVHDTVLANHLIYLEEHKIPVKFLASCNI